MTALYIFDLDGTLALCDHRRPILEDLSNPNRWDDFYRACVDDKPNRPIINILEALCAYADEPADFLIFSGRSELVRPGTIFWLQHNAYVGFHHFNSRLFMRPLNDFTPDDVLKHQFYETVLNDEDKKRLECVFDDRQKVVDMWRSMGVTCLQVAPGDF